MTAPQMPREFYCPRCGKQVDAPPPDRWHPGMMIFCSAEHAQDYREGQWDVDRCPACGEPDPGAEHEGRDDKLHAEYRRRAAEVGSREYMDEFGIDSPDEP
jgi:hypothetical protein